MAKKLTGGMIKAMLEGSKTSVRGEDNGTKNCLYITENQEIVFTNSYLMGAVDCSGYINVVDGDYSAVNGKCRKFHITGKLLASDVIAVYPNEIVVTSKDGCRKDSYPVEFEKSLPEETVKRVLFDFEGEEDKPMVKIDTNYLLTISKIAKTFSSAAIIETTNRGIRMNLMGNGSILLARMR